VELRRIKTRPTAAETPTERTIDHGVTIVFQPA
jgi:hypothetical protein